MHAALPCLLAGLMALALPAHADGTFAQIDMGADTTTAVVARQIDTWSISAAATRHESGYNIGASLRTTLASPGGAAIKAGPALGWIESDEDGARVEAGIAVGIDRWINTPFGGVYGLAEANSIDRAWLASLQAQHTASGWGVEATRGGSDSYTETTLAVRKRLGDSPYFLRGGYAFEAQSVFAGFAINTF